MAKKECSQEIEFQAENDQQFEEPIFEAEAYATPQPEVGADVTVTKPIGIGAPVPIIAPRHTTVQLQPIVVPLAVIPYMSMDSDVLQANRQAIQQAYAVQEPETVAQATEFASVEQAKVKKQCKAQPRVFSFFTLLLSVLTLLPFILSYWIARIAGQALNPEFDIIRHIMGWVENGFAFSPVTKVVYIAVAALAAVLIISTLITLIAGKYCRVLNCLLSLGTAIGMVAVLVKDLVKDIFVVEDRIVFIVITCITVLNAILAIIFSCALNRLDDKVERIEREI